MGKVEIQRIEKEASVYVVLEIDRTGNYNINTGCGFLNHMLELFAAHGKFDLTIQCKGDIGVDDHHTVEDVGIVLGSAFQQALGVGKGICRYGSIHLPMDEALILVAVDLCGRGTLVNKLEIPTQKVGNFDTELVNEFLLAFTRELKLSLHIHQLAGVNSHHIIEGAFKGLGRALRQAVAIDQLYQEEIPSTKGVL